MAFLRKIKNNKVLSLVIIVIFVSASYMLIQNFIEKEKLKSNTYIFRENEQDEDYGKKIETDRIEKRDSEGKIIENNEDDEKNSNGEIKEDDCEENSTQNKIYIYVTGEVNSPGVVILNKGSRIVDAINEAGGTTDMADITKINLVYILEDGMKVNIPSVEKTEEPSNFQYVTSDSGDGKSDNSSHSSSERTYNVVNINTATQTELETLPGIGPSLALKIINYRKENGSFSSIEDIKNVSGIGDSKFKNLKKYLTV